MCMQSFGKENLLRQCMCPVFFWETEVYMPCGNYFVSIALTCTLHLEPFGVSFFFSLVSVIVLSARRGGEDVFEAIDAGYAAPPLQSTPGR